MPMFLSATALQGLAHPDGEVCMARAAGTKGIIQMVPTFSSKSLEQIAAARVPGQVQFFQLYINSNRSITESLLKKVQALGFAAVFVTIDAPMLGRRDRDRRHKFTGQLSREHEGASGDKTAVNRSSGVGVALSSYIASNVTWDDIPWVKSVAPRLKVVLKGVQRGDDAARAVKLGVDGILLSNHGGRQLDSCRSGVEVLLEVTEALKREGLDNRAELYVDGGIWRGSDIVKCVALGARAVGVGRAAVYAMAAFGQQGVERCIDMFQEEVLNTMSLLGAKNIAEITPDLIVGHGRDKPVHSHL
jgi:L-lactate dehydrogenase (cytochrome)